MLEVTTFSVAARCARTGMLGVAVSTAVPGVGGICPFVKPGVGAVSTQSWVNPYLGIDGLKLLEQGSTAQEALDTLIAADPGNSDAGPRIAMRVSIDVSRLNFETIKDRRAQKLTVIAALLDEAGNFVVGRQAEAELALKNAGFEALAATGLTVALSLHAPPGMYNLRVLVQEALTGKMTAVSRPLEIR